MNAVFMSTKEGVKEQVVEKTIDNHTIVLYNDDVNTFDHVIKSLVDVCGHSIVQADQCAHIVHYKGKCKVAAGSMEELVPKCVALLDRQLSAEIK